MIVQYKVWGRLEVPTGSKNIEVAILNRICISTFCIYSNNYGMYMRVEPIGIDYITERI
jgi:hypothetical protein